ncbi:MAG: hypothetical protein Q9168_007164, partial [Polycauliona sp. 1 TL-2023]
MATAQILPHLVSQHDLEGKQRAVHSQAAGSKDQRDTGLLLAIHLQLPQHRHRENQKNEIDDDIAEPMRFGDVVRFRAADGVGIKLKLHIPIGLDWLAPKDLEQEADEGPDDKGHANGPGGDPESDVDLEDA